MPWTTTGRLHCIFVAIIALNCCLWLARASREAPRITDDNSDILFFTPEIVINCGYPLDIHNIVTEDGYILQLHRIPYGHNENEKEQSKTRLPILLVHGLAGSSADWILTGPEKSLAYILADAGYDVWLGNNRGNIYSRNHTSLSPTDRAFWDFSYHELGIFDLPAMIDHVIYTTGYDRIFYGGHSQGTTQFLVMISEKPEYNSKIILMIGMAPAAFTGNIGGPIRKLTKLTYFGVWVGETFGYPELHSRSAWEKFILSLYCQNAASTKFICNHLFFFLIVGFKSDELSDMENFTDIITHLPAGASWKQLVHYGQGYIDPGHFRQFNYGEKKNFRLYNSTIPPVYQLERITMPIALFTSDNDWLAATKDVELLSAKLSNVVFHYNVPISIPFNHYHFLWGKSAKQLIFEPILQLLTQYQ